MSAAVDTAHVPGASASLVAALDGTIKDSHGVWAADSEQEVVKLAMQLLEDAGAIIAAQSAAATASAAGRAPATAKAAFKRVSVSFPDTGVAYIITLDKDHVYIVKTTLTASSSAGAAAVSDSA